MRRRVAALEAVVSGGANLGCRYTPQRMCPRCGDGNAAVETPWHRYFECEANRDIEDPDGWLRRSMHLLPSVRGEWLHWQCLWARGIVPGPLWHFDDPEQFEQ
eukprot:8444612-Lingulodinium_polyedra.AAC.1